MLKISRVLATLLCGALLTACGGGGSSSTPINVSAGVYSGTVDGAPWLTVLLPDNVSTNWYSLHYLTNNADLYSGKFTGVGSANATAASADLIYSPANAKPLHNGSGSMSAPITSTLSTSLNILSANSDPGKNVNASLTSTATTAQFSDLNGPWTGQISYGDAAVVNNKTITFTAASNAATANNFDFTACFISNINLTPTPQVNTFNVSLQLDAQTGCRFTEAPSATSFSLTGVAFITPSPKTLYFLAIKTSGPNKGQGFSFKGTPSPV